MNMQDYGRRVRENVAACQKIIGKDLDQHECNQIAGMVRHMMQAEELKHMNPEAPRFVPPAPDALS